MVVSDAFLVDGYLVCFDMEDIEIILRDCRKIQIEMGTFKGYVNENGTPIGVFISDQGTVIEVFEDYATNVIKLVIA